MSLAIVRAARGDGAVLQNLFQLYTHDFSEFWAGSARGELPGEGACPFRTVPGGR